MPSRLPELTDASLQQVVAQTRIPLLILFHSPASRPARAQVSLLEDLAPAYKGVLEMQLAPVEACPRALETYGILTLPTCLTFRQGRVVDRFTGLLTRERFGERIELALQAI